MRVEGDRWRTSEMISQAGLAGQIQVDQQQVGRIREAVRQAGIAIRKIIHGLPAFALLQRAFKQLPKNGFVLDERDAGRLGGRAGRGFHEAFG